MQTIDADGTEEKVLIGFRSQTEALNCLRRNYDDSLEIVRVTAIPMPRFKQWLEMMQGSHQRPRTLSTGADPTINHGGIHSPKPEIGYDLDGSLAEHVKPFNPNVVGKLRPEAVDKVHRLESMGYKVWIFTARPDLQPVIRFSLDTGLDLPVTNVKRPTFVAIIDDRAVPEDASMEETITKVKELT